MTPVLPPVLPGRAATIYALASGRGRAGIAVVRLSGNQSDSALRALAGRLPPPRHAARVSLRCPKEGVLLDEALALRFPGPASYTGEDVAELHLHGGPATIRAVLGALARLPGLRLAEPGEFTRRAFDNGRMDLTAAEGIADLVAAETEAQRRQALAQAGGALQQLYDAWSARLTRLLAWREAEIDFADEPLPDDLQAEIMQAATALAAEMAARLDDGRRGERLRDGVRIAVIGAPNAGKSSLVNALARRDAAIVSAEAGTTRDVLDVHLELDGWPVVLSDTAGLRDTRDAVEREGVRRARQAAAAADLRLLVVDATAGPDLAGGQMPDADLIVLNKADLCLAAPPPGPAGAIAVSALTGAGLPQLLQRLSALAAGQFDRAEAVVITRARHREALTEALEHLRRGLTAPETDLAAEDWRLALRALGRITGRVGVEDLLDVIFRDFCIGT